MTINILAINLGGTTTKIGYAVNNKMQFKKTIDHSMEELRPFRQIKDQIDYRIEKIMTFLNDNNIKTNDLNAIVSRAGVLPPIEAGGYEINQAMIDYNLNYSKIDHVSNIGPKIAFEIANQLGIKAFIYDGETLDQLMPLARFSGTHYIEKQSIGHLLNMRSVARIAAEKLNKPVGDTNFIIAHMGGGTSISAVAGNRIVDVLADDESAFSVERAGSIALKHIINMCYDLPKEEVMRILRKEGGLYSYLGTNDGREIEQRISNGDEYAALVFEALAYQVAKGCGEMAIALTEPIDGIILTGGLAHSAMICNWIEKWAGKIASIIKLPGEYEMEALLSGGYRVFVDEEETHQFKIKGDN